MGDTVAGPGRMTEIDLPYYRVLGVKVSAVDMPKAVETLDRLARRPGTAPGAYVCVRDVNGIMESQRDPALLAIHERAAMVTPDGMPVVWLGKRSGRGRVDRVYGPDLLHAVCAVSVECGYRHFFYGGGEGVADLLARRLGERFAGLAVVGTHCPPFRPLREDERRVVADEIRASGADFVWVGLSTPKQERFMAEMAPLLPGVVLLGVGAAFDFHAGLKPQAPRWLQRSGLEWAFRLATEPRRLWRRYLVNNSGFLALLLTHELRQALGRPAGRAAPAERL